MDDDNANKHKVSVKGLNDRAWVTDGALMIVDRALTSSNDRMTIFVEHITALELDRKAIGKNVLTVRVGAWAIDLKSATAGELRDELHAEIRRVRS